jgi:hypothetical protein
MVMVAIFPVVPVITVLVTVTAVCSPVDGFTCVAVQAVVPPELESSLAVQICCTEVSAIVPAEGTFVVGVNPKTRSPPATVPFNVVRVAVTDCAVKAAEAAQPAWVEMPVVSVVVSILNVTAPGITATLLEAVIEATLPAAMAVPAAKVTLSTVVEVVAPVQVVANAVPSLVHATVVAARRALKIAALAVMVTTLVAASAAVGVNQKAYLPGATPVF